MSPAKAMRQAVARAAEDVAGMEASVSGFVQQKTTVDKIVEGLAEPHLIYLTEGPDGAVGLALLDSQATAAVIEQMTTGRVVPSRAEPRAATRTDAVIVATILDRILEIFDEGLAQMPDAPPVAGYRQSVALEDGRAVAMALEDMPYRLYRLSLDFGRGAKMGELRLIFPYDPSGQDQAAATLDAQWRSGWHAAVMQTQTVVEAVLHRFTIPLDEIGSLGVGALIPIPLAAVAQVSLEGSDGQCVATGKLGQCNGHRAVRVGAGPVGEGASKSVLSAQDFVIAGADAAVVQGEAVAVDPATMDAPAAGGSEGAGADQSGEAKVAELGAVV